MTFRGYHARIIAVAQNALEMQKSMTIAVTMGIAGAFAKEGGFSAMLKTLDDSSASLRDVMSGLFEGNLSPAPGGSSSDRPRVLPLPRPARRGRERTTEDVQRDIRRLDAIMSKLTGAPVLNPLGGYREQGVAPVSAYDIGRTSSRDLISRM